MTRLEKLELIIGVILIVVVACVCIVTIHDRISRQLDTPRQQVQSGGTTAAYGVGK